MSRSGNCKSRNSLVLAYLYTPTSSAYFSPGSWERPGAAVSTARTITKADQPTNLPRIGNPSVCETSHHQQNGRAARIFPGSPSPGAELLHLASARPGRSVRLPGWLRRRRELPHRGWLGPRPLRLVIVPRPAGLTCRPPRLTGLGLDCGRGV